MPNSIYPSELNIYRYSSMNTQQQTRQKYNIIYDSTTRGSIITENKEIRHVDVSDEHDCLNIEFALALILFKYGDNLV